MIFKVDKRIYPDNCISKAVYSLVGKYNIERSSLSENEESLCITSKIQLDDDTVKAEVFDCLNDYKLRYIIEKETHDIRTILYAKAFLDCDDIAETDLN